MRYYLLSFLLLLCVCPAGAQKGKKVTATYHYVSNNANESPSEAKERAVMLARTQVLSQEYGTIISSVSIDVNKAVNDSTTNEFFSLDASEIKGEWYETISTKFGKIEYDERGFIIVDVETKGWIRPIEMQQIDIDARILCNGTDPERNLLRKAFFQDRDNIYLYFKSPVEGYLAMYIVDNDESMTVQCLLPYARQTDGICHVVANKEYTFFSKTLAEDVYAQVTRQLIMRCRNDVDYNHIYILFSPRPFTKSNDTEVNDNLPPQLPYKKFQEWLGRNRRRDPQMQVQKVMVEIAKPK